METSPIQPNDPQDAVEKQKGSLTPEGRRRRDILSMATTYLSAAPGWGERLLPYLFMAMETCWIAAILIGLASLNFFQSREALMPVWSPFVLMAGAYWLSAYLERRELASIRPVDTAKNAPADVSGSRLVFVFVAIVTLFVVWLSVYLSSFLLDPRWLLAMLSDLLLLDATAYRVIVIIVLSVYFCWRGVRLSRRLIGPANILLTLRIGLGVILAVIVIGVGESASSFAESTLLLLIPLFLSLVLIAHAIAQALFLRRSSPGGLQGSIAAQERALLMVIGMIGLFLFLVALAIGTFTSPAILVQMQQALRPIGLAYDWLIGAVAYIVILLLTPIFWLVSQLHLKVQVPGARFLIPSGNLAHKPSPAPEALLLTISILKLVLPLLVVGLLLLLIRFALRRRRVVLLRPEEGDVHESLWSWELFWTQLKGLLHALWLRLFHRRVPTKEEVALSALMQGGPTTRSIRELYRALLHWAASQGYARKKYETPYEFQLRLHEHLPQTEPELGAVTEAYTATRYGEVVPGEDEVDRVRQMWMNLQQK
jgi:hypothetical protein